MSTKLKLTFTKNANNDYIWDLYAYPTGEGGYSLD